jgi:hypothetical protein
MDTSGNHGARITGGTAREVLISDLRASEAINDELEWFFGPALGDIEPGSNFWPLAQRALVGGPLRGRGEWQSDSGKADRRVEAMHQARKIYDLLCKLPPRDLWALRTLYTPGAELPRILDDLCGWLAPLVCAMPWVVVAYQTAFQLRETDVPNAAEYVKERYVMFGMPELAPRIAEAQAAATRALEAYQAIRGKGPTLAPGDREEV